MNIYGIDFVPTDFPSKYIFMEVFKHVNFPMVFDNFEQRIYLTSKIDGGTPSDSETW